MATSNDQGDGELLPRESKEPAPAPLKEERQPAKRSRERSLEHKEKDKTEEISEQGMLVEILGRLAVNEGDKNRLLDLYDRMRVREGIRTDNLQRSQRDYMGFMMADKSRDMTHIKDITTAFIGLADKYGEMKQAAQPSKAEEIAGVFTIVMQMPIMVALQEMLIERLGKKKPLKDPAKEKERRRLLKQLNSLEAEDEDE